MPRASSSTNTNTNMQTAPRHSLAAVLCNPFLLLVEIHLFLPALPPAPPRPWPTTLVSLSEGWISKGGPTLVRPLRGGIAGTAPTTTITFYDWWKLTKFPYRRSILLPLVRTLFIDLPVASAEVAQPLIVTPFWPSNRVPSELTTAETSPRHSKLRSALASFSLPLFPSPLAFAPVSTAAFTRNITVVRVCPPYARWRVEVEGRQRKEVIRSEGVRGRQREGEEKKSRLRRQWRISNFNIAPVRFEVPSLSWTHTRRIDRTVGRPRARIFYPGGTSNPPRSHVLRTRLNLGNHVSGKVQLYPLQPSMNTRAEFLWSDS